MSVIIKVRSSEETLRSVEEKQRRRDAERERRRKNKDKINAIAREKRKAAKLSMTEEELTERRRKATERKRKSRSNQSSKKKQEELTKAKERSRKRRSQIKERANPTANKVIVTSCTMNIKGEDVSGFDTLSNVPIKDALQFVMNLDQNKCWEWEDLQRDGGYFVYYYRTHIEHQAAAVTERWQRDCKEHGTIKTPIKEWPDIPPVFKELSESIIDGYSPIFPIFREKYFLGQVQVSKMECKHSVKHNEFGGNKVGRHIDHKREGDIILCVLLAEHIVLRLLNRRHIVQDVELPPGSGYCIRCPDSKNDEEEENWEDIADDNHLPEKCRLLYCPRHSLQHEIECGHPKSCKSKHHPKSVTERLPERTGPRYAVLFRYFFDDKQ